MAEADPLEDRGSQKEPSDRRLSRPVIFALAGAVVIAVAIGMSIWSKRREEAPQAPQASTNAAAPTTPAAPAKSAATAAAPSTPNAAANAPSPAPAPPPTAESAPSFDVVRIARDGRAVMAGRAAPGATVIIMDGDREVGRVKADPRGEWVFTLDKPLEPGSRELSLRANNPGGAEKEGEAPVVLVVPERTQESPGKSTASAAGSNEALAIKVNPGGAVQLLQVPASSAGSGPVSVDVVNFDGQGNLSVAGRAAPQSNIQVYLDNELLGSTTSDAKGGWSLSVAHPMNPGDHTVRADQVGGDGKVTARADISFPSGAGGSNSGKVTVAFGNSLWRIAKRAYGKGFDYVVIYNANKQQIRDPDLIYPGQVFKLPTKG
jgi:nucleoid-associated protein YgaU